MHYYILFNNYEEALSAREVLSEGNVLNRIAPLPYVLIGEVSCGVSLLLNEGDEERARECLDAHHTFYHSIVAYDGGLNPKRDRYC